MKKIDIIKYILENYEDDEDIEWCFYISTEIDKLKYFIWTIDWTTKIESNISLLPTISSKKITQFFNENLFLNK